MERIADDVHRLSVTPRDGINVYLVGDVLIDAGVKQSAGKILKALAGRTVAAHALTHAHVDHAGASKKVVSELGIPMWAPAGDAEAVQSGKPPATNAILQRLGGFPALPVDRRLGEGDEIGAGFVVLDTPGHSPGHVSYWRESDRILVCGDVFFGMNVITTMGGPRQPIKAFTIDPERNRESERRLAALEPAVTLFGHGKPCRDASVLKSVAA
jgi:hydroxyacylglutathione hydrolase